MPRLVLFRHAKSDWDDPDLPDIDRPLARRGRLAAPLMGAWLAEEGLVPDLVLTSPARRARETWERARGPAGAGAQVETRALADLYMAAPETALAVLREAGGEAGCVALVGHEPGMGELLRRLHDGRAPGGLARAFEKFPTGAVAALELPGPWSALDWGGAAFTRFACPKDLV